MAGGIQHALRREAQGGVQLDPRGARSASTSGSIRHPRSTMRRWRKSRRACLPPIVSFASCINCNTRPTGSAKGIPSCQLCRAHRRRLSPGLSMIAVVTIVALHCGIGVAVLQNTARGGNVVRLGWRSWSPFLCLRSGHWRRASSRSARSSAIGTISFPFAPSAIDFDAAASPREKIHVMEEMERLTFDEMCDFLKTHAHARFVM